MSKKLLKDCAYYVTDRISSSNLTSENYIGVDNMLPNKAGVTLSESVPTSGDVIAFNTGDILIGNIRPYFKKIWLATFDGGCSPDVLCIRCNRDMPPEYLYGVLSQDSFFDYDMAGSKGSKMPRGDKNHIMNYPIPILNDMSKIGDFIIDINAKISNNNCINAELESMAKTIYDYWFTQFDFPDENGKPYKSSGGKMVWNEELKREIPEGWERVLLKDIENNIVTGKTPSTKCPEYYNGDIPFITIGDIRENTYIVSTEQKLSKTGADTQLKKYIPNNSLCVSCIASPGLIGFATTDSQTNQQINSIIFSNENNKFFLYFALNDFFSNSRGAKTGNTFDNMNKEEFSNIIMIYSSDIVSLFHKKVEPIFNMIRKNSVENQQLASLRDWLLPMLMNGQVRFKVVE